MEIFTGQLLPAALQKFMQQPTTRAPDAVAPQRDGNGVEGSSTRVLPELAFIETLSTIRSLPDFSQRLATVNEYGQALLHLAVHLRYHKLVQQLVEWGVGLDVQDINGFTALHCAYLCDDDLVVTILKQSGASVSIFDALGRLPSDLLARPVAMNLDVEMADAADSDATPHSRASSENSLAGSMQEHQDTATEWAGCSTADEAFSPPMSPHSSDQRTAENDSTGDPDDSPPTFEPRSYPQPGHEPSMEHNCDPVAQQEAQRGCHHEQAAYAQHSSEIPIDIATVGSMALAALGIPVLDTELRDRTWRWEQLMEDVLAINVGDDHIIDERLLQFFEQDGDKFYCRLPINDPKHGETYCNAKLGRKKRILGHLRAHLNYRPFICGGDCGNPSW